MATYGSPEGRYPIQQPVPRELGVAIMDRSHVLPPWGPHRERLELAEHGRPLIAGHEGFHPVHSCHHVRRR